MKECLSPVPSNHRVHGKRPSQTWNGSKCRGQKVKPLERKEHLISLVEDELMQGYPPRFRTPAFSHAGNSSVVQGMAGAWLCSLQWPQDLHEDSQEPSLLMEGLRGPLGCENPWRYTSTKLRKTVWKRLIFRVHTSTVTDNMTQLGPPWSTLEKMHFKQRWACLQSPRGQVPSAHPPNGITKQPQKRWLRSLHHII